MSHIVRAQTHITCPNLPAFLAVQHDPEARAQHPFLALLLQAVRLVAKEVGGTIKPSYLDYYGKLHAVNTGLVLYVGGPDRPAEQRLHRGLGLSIDQKTGVLTFVSDPYHVEAFSEQVQRKIVQRYLTLAYMAALSEQYQTSVQHVEQGLVAVTGVRHA